MKSFNRLVYPYIAWSVVMIVIPVFLIALFSIINSDGGVITLRFTLDNFGRFFSDAIFVEVLIRSLRIAFFTTIICIVVGYPAAYAISKLSPNSQHTAVLLITLPMLINMLVRTYAWRGILIATNFSPEIKVYIGMVYNFIPFMILQIYTSLSKMDPNLEIAAHDLGCDDLNTFTKVILPLSIPGIISGITLVFLPAVSSFFIPKLLGGGSFVVIGNLIESFFLTAGNWNFGSAISIIMTIVILISMYITKKFDYSKGASDEK